MEINFLSKHSQCKKNSYEYTLCAITRFSSQSEPVPFEPLKNSAKQAIFFLPFFYTKWTKHKTNRKQVAFLEYLIIFWNVVLSLKKQNFPCTADIDLLSLRFWYCWYFILHILRPDLI